MNLWLTAGDLDSSQGCTIFVTNVRTQQTLVVMKTTNYKMPVYMEVGNPR